MEIQQHDGVVVDVAGLRQGFAELLRERERERGVAGEEGGAQGCVLLPSPLYIGPLGGRRPREMGSPRGGGGQRGGRGALPPKARGKERLMEIQQHDGVVVDVAGLGRASPSFCERERCCRGGGRRPRL